MIITIHVHPQSIPFHGISILLRFAKCTKGVRWTAEATDILLAGFRPAHHIRKIARTAQGLSIEISGTIERNARQDSIQEFVFYHIHIAGISCGFEHTPG